MRGSYATAALNIGATGGPLLAAASLDLDQGNLGPVWTSCLLVALALILAPTLLRSLKSQAARE